jgi:hypothetical protein
VETRSISSILATAYLSFTSTISQRTDLFLDRSGDKDREFVEVADSLAGYSLFSDFQFDFATDGQSKHRITP